MRRRNGQGVSKNSNRRRRARAPPFFSIPPFRPFHPCCAERNARVGARPERFSRSRNGDDPRSAGFSPQGFQTRPMDKPADLRRDAFAREPTRAAARSASASSALAASDGVRRIWKGGGGLCRWRGARSGRRVCASDQTPVVATGGLALLSASRCFAVLRSSFDAITCARRSGVDAQRVLADASGARVRRRLAVRRTLSPRSRGLASRTASCARSRSAWGASPFRRRDATEYKA
jgi:hypothetical protein